MRKTRKNQQSLSEGWGQHPRVKELKTASDILDDNPRIAELATQDLIRAGVNAGCGAPGMTGDAVVRAAILKNMEGLSYEDLAFYLEDSRSFRRFCRYGIGDSVPRKSALQANISLLRPETWKAINDVLMGYARTQGLERGDKVRLDCTAVDANIVEPADSQLLYDTVRVVTRELKRVRKAGYGISFADHKRKARRSQMEINYAKRKDKRVKPYKDLLKCTEATLKYADESIKVLSQHSLDRAAERMLEKLERFSKLGRRVVDQTRRRIIQKETVPAAEKVTSLFEDHADIIRKDNRKTTFGHKVAITAGRYLILDTSIEKGNPADVVIFAKMLERVEKVTGRVPRQMAADGGFASKANLEEAKRRGVEDMCFSKKRGMQIDEMVKSTWVYRRLKKFRAGVEGKISFLKRGFGMRVCNWSGFDGFQSYVLVSTVACNLLIMARLLQAREVTH